MPHYPIKGKVAQSDYVADEIINPHPRFATLTRSIRKRRGKKVDIRVPVFQDENTEVVSDIHMDAMAFGMGCACLQVTFQAKHVCEARHLYDQLAILTPIMMALTANTPFFRGMVSDWDVRWSVISQSVDDRSPSEKGFFAKEDFGRLKKGDMVDGLFDGKWYPCKIITINTPKVIVERHESDGQVTRGVIPRGDLTSRIMPYKSRTDAENFGVPKSRYDSISTFLSCKLPFKEDYNDIHCPTNKTAYERLREAGIDHAMSRHIAHLWIRDPLVIYQERLEDVDDEKETEHFENIQSTNWQNVRFKPPPFDSPIGWRVEFRTME